MLKHYALSHVQDLHRKGQFHRRKRMPVCKGALLGGLWGIAMSWLAHDLPVSQRSIWLGLGMWVAVGFVVFSLFGYAMARFYRLGLEQMRELHDSGRCPFCGYDLRGSTQNCCPECGTKVERP